MSEAKKIAAAGPAGRETAAILLMLLQEDEAATLLSRLDPEEVQQLGEAMFAVADVSERQVNTVLDEFVGRARQRTTLGFGSDGHIRGVMARALGDRAGDMLQRITPPTHATALDALKWMDVDAIAGAIDGEHPQIAAIVLAHLDAPKAAAVLEKMDESRQADVVYRVARLGPVTQDALEELDRILATAKRGPAPSAATKRGGPNEAAQIVNNVPTAIEQRLVRQLTKLDKNLARAIEDEMFVFDNLMAVSEKDIGTLFRNVENELVVVGLKSCDQRLRDRILGSMSARAAQSIQDEMAERGPMRLSEVQEAQKAILAIARRLADESQISLGGKSDDDFV
jgi:flagellar motor switch protein FliG